MTWLLTSELGFQRLSLGLIFDNPPQQTQAFELVPGSSQAVRRPYGVSVYGGLRYFKKVVLS